MPLLYRLLFICFVALQPILASDSGTPYSVLLSCPEDVEGWIMTGSITPVIDKMIRTPNPIPITSIELVQVDPSGKIILVRSPGENALSHRFYNFEGEMQAEFETAWNPDIPLPVVLMEATKQRIFTWDMVGRLKCYRFSGALLWEHQLISAPVFSYENSYFARIGETRKELFLAISLPDTDSDGGYESHLLKTDTNGELLASETIRGMKLLDVLATETNRIAAVYRVGHNPGTKSRVETHILDEHLETSMILPETYRAMYDAGPSHMILAGKSAISMIDLQNASVLWNYTTGNINTFIGDLAYDAAQKRILLVAGQPEYVSGRLSLNHPRVEFLNHMGKHITEVEPGNVKLYPGAFRINREEMLELGGEHELLELDLNKMIRE